MTEFQFINAMSTQHHNAVIVDEFTSGLMAQASRQHLLAVHQAKQHQDTRSGNRYTRSLRRAHIMDTAVMAATIVGIAVATWFLTSIGVI